MKVRQIFINLLSNAIKFTEKGSITISAFNVEGGVQFSVKDTGIGIKSEDLSAIFDPYKQVDDMFRRKRGGSGLGLTIVKSALRMLHGTIDVQSEFGVGSTFTVFLPKIPLNR
jgi:signal transduction histidine kinase